MDKCSRCSESAVRLQGHQWLCAKHYRFGQMRADAKRNGKVVPSHNELAQMVPADLRCPDCNAVMNWLAQDNQTHVASLQHYCDGTLAIVCRSCNTRHAYAPQDSFRDAPRDSKFCPQCEQHKPFSEYYADKGRSGPMKLKSWCRACSDAAVMQWRGDRRDQYNASQRAGRARRKAAVSC